MGGSDPAGRTLQSRTDAGASRHTLSHTFNDLGGDRYKHCQINLGSRLDWVFGNLWILSSSRSVLMRTLVIAAQIGEVAKNEGVSADPYKCLSA